MPLTFEQTLSNADMAKAQFDKVSYILDQCYEYCLPLRQRSYLNDPGSKRTDRLFDSTAIASLHDFASSMLDDVWPADQKPILLEAGPDVDPAEREEANKILSRLADRAILAINNSNFRSAAHESFLDWGIGTGAMAIEQGDPVEPIVFTALPLTQVWLMRGPMGGYDGLYWPREIKLSDIRVIWPKAKLPDDLDPVKTPQRMVSIVRAIERDRSERGAETWIDRIFIKEKKFLMLEETYKGYGSCPFVAFDYNRTAGETIGRGPAQIALPDIKTLNKTQELTLENADLAISGVWQAEDDGIINFDNLRLNPGSVIPKAPGSKGLEPIQSPARFDVSALIIEDMQNRIKAIFQTENLGPPTGTPMTATEVLQRTRDRAKRQSGPYNRLLTEFLNPIVRRVAYLLDSEFPKIDGKKIVLRPLAPITRAQAQDDILRHQQAFQIAGQLFGPQVLNLFVDQGNFLEFLENKMGLDPNVIRSDVEREQLARQIAELGQPADPEQIQQAPA
jgi:hypothetical protein